MRQILKVVGLLAVCTACAQASVASESVTKVRFGSLGRNDLVVTDVDIRGGAATNLVAGPGIAIDYVPEGTRISATGGQGGVDTNGVEGLIALYDRTNTTVRLARKADSNRVEVIHGAVALLAEDVATKAAEADLEALERIVDLVAQDLYSQQGTVTSLASFTSNIWTTVASYVPWLENLATNNYYAARLANFRAKRLEIWQAAISNDLLLASADAGALKPSSYFTGSNRQLVGTVDGRFSADNPSFSNAVLAVGIGTNSVLAIGLKTNDVIRIVNDTVDTNAYIRTLARQADVDLRFREKTDDAVYTNAEVAVWHPQPSFPPGWEPRTEQPSNFGGTWYWSFVGHTATATGPADATELVFSSTRGSFIARSTKEPVPRPSGDRFATALELVGKADRLGGTTTRGGALGTLLDMTPPDAAEPETAYGADFAGTAHTAQTAGQAGKVKDTGRTLAFSSTGNRLQVLSPGQGSETVAFLSDITTPPGPIPVGSVPGNAICWTNNAVRTFDGTKTVGAADFGAVPTSRTINGQTLDHDITIQAGVASVNGETGAVTINVTKLGAVPTSRTINGQPLTDDITISAGVSSVNGQTGAVVLNADSVEALPDDSAALSANPRFQAAVKSVELPLDFVTNGIRTVTVGTRPSLATAPAWSDTKTYRMSDVVQHEGLLYICTASPYDTVGPSAWGLQHDHWTEVRYGLNSFACGSTNTAAGTSSRADGCSVAALGDNAHAEGVFTVATGPASHAEGTSTRAYGTFTHAEGIQTAADGMASHAEGSNSQSGGIATHAEGYQTDAEGFASHASGYATMAFGLASFSSGIWTYADGDGESIEDRAAATAMGWGAVAQSAGAFVWQGLPEGRDPLEPPEESEDYPDNGPGTFNINPVGGASGFYIGKTNLVDLVRAIAGPTANASALPSFSASDPAFAAAVQSVVLSMGALRAYDAERQRWYRVKVANGRFELEKE